MKKKSRQRETKLKHWFLFIFSQGFTSISHTSSYHDRVVTLHSLDFKSANHIDLTRPGLGRTAYLTWSPPGKILRLFLAPLYWTIWIQVARPLFILSIEKLDRFEEETDFILNYNYHYNEWLFIYCRHKISSTYVLKNWGEKKENYSIFISYFTQIKIRYFYFLN